MPTCPIEDNPTHCLSIHLSLPSFTRRTQNHFSSQAFSSFFVLKTLLFLLQKILRRSLLLKGFCFLEREGGAKY
ncbi:unnamed protein product [Brassica rapa]|uniref:Uncharacterized protein n=1 Tax=Brassica campestris TaxID=3711 RepID=A0A8D9HD02_BRACM|nr:unnamed protein product [Brassica rapa]